MWVRYEHQFLVRQFTTVPKVVFFVSKYCQDFVLMKLKFEKRLLIQLKYPMSGSFLPMAVFVQ